MKNQLPSHPQAEGDWEIDSGFSLPPSCQSPTSISYWLNLVRSQLIRELGKCSFHKGGNSPGNDSDTTYLGPVLLRLTLPDKFAYT